MDENQNNYAVSIPVIARNYIRRHHFAGTPPYSAAEAIRGLEGLTDGGIEVVAYMLDIPTASAKAIAAEALVPSEAIIIKIAELCELKETEITRLKLAATHSIQRTGNNKKFYSALGKATINTSMEELLVEILEEKNETRTTWLSGHGIPKSSIGSVVHGSAAWVPEKYISALNKAFGGDKYSETLLREINSRRKPRRPADHLLAEYLEDGKTSFSGFIQYVMDEWEVDAHEMSKITNTVSSGRYDAYKIQRQMEADKIKDMATLDRWANGLGFSEKGKYEFCGLAKGNASLGSIRSIIESYKSKMRSSIQTDSNDERWKTARELLETLVERTGIPLDVLPAKVTHVVTKGKSFNELHDLTTADRITAILIPYDNKLAKSAADILLGVAEVKSASDLLKDVQAAKMDVREMTRVRRVAMRMTHSQFCGAVDCKNDEFNRKGIAQPTYSAFERRAERKSMSMTPKHEREALARHIGLADPTEIAAFTELVTHLYIPPAGHGWSR